MSATSSRSSRGGLPLVPVQRDDHGTFIAESAKVCFLDHRSSPQHNEAGTPLTATGPLVDRIA